MADEYDNLPKPPEVSAVHQSNVDSLNTKSISEQQRPAVPPKPQIDLVRYSIANANKEDDLDEILGELLELEKQLSSDDGSKFLFMGYSSLKPSKTSPDTSTSTEPIYNKKRVTCALNDTCTSPDGDSAFCDTGSIDNYSAETNRSSVVKMPFIENNREYIRREPPQVAHPSPMFRSQLAEKNQVTDEADEKAKKIKEALEKMKEAKIKKIYVKIFLEDGQSKGLLIDERWTVLETMRQLSSKLNINLTEDFAIVEECPDLYIRRIYEDHEFVVENIEDWLADSKNKIYMIKVKDKYNFIRDPQNFLINAKSEFDFPQANSNEWVPQMKERLIKQFLQSSLAPELDGHLYLKSDGKKSWKKYYFVLRSSGLYYCSKSKFRSTKDLTCLMNIYSNQIYTGIDWRKKYKAPSQFGFAIKHPKIQVKTSKYIKYICADDECSYVKWVTALRITRNTLETLFNNYCSFSKDDKQATSYNEMYSPARPYSGEYRQPQQIMHSSEHSHDARNDSPASFSLSLKQSPSICSQQSHSNTCNQSGMEDDDSDEEYFPPPPEVIYSSPQFTQIINSPTTMHPSPMTESTQSAAFQFSRIQLSNSKKLPPPPPPKRSENTRLISNFHHNEIGLDKRNSTGNQSSHTKK